MRFKHIKDQLKKITTAKKFYLSMTISENNHHKFRKEKIICDIDHLDFEIKFFTPANMISWKEPQSHVSITNSPASNAGEILLSI